MILYTQIDIPSEDLHFAADDANMTVSQFIAAAIVNAVEAQKRRNRGRREFVNAIYDAELGVIPGGD